MDFIAWLGSGVLYLPSFLFVLGVIIFVHEMGHFLVARWFGVDIDAFSLGFGPEILGWHDRRGTRWKICAVPLGGYVKFAGDDNAASMPNREALARLTPLQRSGSFYLKPTWQRAAVVAAGPAANFILAIAILATVFAVAGRPWIEASVGRVLPDSPAAEAGFQPGDVILAIDGKPIDDFSDVSDKVSMSADRAVAFEVRRGESVVELTATPREQKRTDRFNNTVTVATVGIERQIEATDLRVETFGPLGAIRAAVEETAWLSARTAQTVYGIIVGEQSIDQLGGPIRVAKVSGDMATLGPEAIFRLIAMLSVSIGLVNLLPIPILDGGHLLFYAIEGVRGRPLSERAQDVGFRIGLTLVFVLMIFVTLNDTRERIGSFLGSVS